MKVVGLEVVVRLKYCITVNLFASPRLSMLFWEEWMLTEMFTEAED